MLMSSTMESIGVMVYRRILPLGMVEELMGGAVEMLWAKLEHWVKDLRDEQSQPELHEWFQWLAERLKQRTVTDQNTSSISRLNKFSELRAYLYSGPHNLPASACRRNAHMFVIGGVLATEGRSGMLAQQRWIHSAS